MKVSIEISMYPLTNHYEPPILDFLADLNLQESIEVRTNGMSTQLFGDYDLLMDVLKKDIKTAFQGEHKVSMVLKILNLDTSGY